MKSQSQGAPALTLFDLNGFDPDPGGSFFIKSYLFRGAQAEINDPVA